MKPMNDIQRAMLGDKVAMERLYIETYPKLRAVTMSILKNESDAEDIVQETYIKAFSNLHQLDDPTKFDSWLCRIASNKCKDYLKKHKPMLFSDINEGNEDDEPFEWSIQDESDKYNPEEVVISDDIRRILMGLVNTLPDDQRICLLYYAVEEMKISEIAQLLEVSESTVKSRIKYAKDKMKAKIEELEKKGVKLRGLAILGILPLLRLLFISEAKAISAGAASFGSAVASSVGTANGIPSVGTGFAQNNAIPINNAVGVNNVPAAGNSAGMMGQPNVTTYQSPIQNMMQMEGSYSANVASSGVKTAVSAGAKTAVSAGAKTAGMSIFTKIVAGVLAAGIAVAAPVAVYRYMQEQDKSSDDKGNLLQDYKEEPVQDSENSDAYEGECEWCGKTKLVKTRMLYDSPGTLCEDCLDDVQFWVDFVVRGESADLSEIYGW